MIDLQVVDVQVCIKIMEKIQKLLLQKKNSQESSKAFNLYIATIHSELQRIHFELENKTFEEESEAELEIVSTDWCDHYWAD